MTKPVIVKRSTKGSHLTFTELDANFQNLDDATISIAVQGENTVVNDLNGTTTLVPSDEIFLAADNTAKTVTVSEKIIRLYAYVHNAEGSVINKGQPVYLYQATGDKPSVKLANNTGDSTSAKVLGLAAETLAIGADGYVITQGKLVGVNTAAYTEGDTLYLGATAGTLTTTKPYAPNHLVYIGVVAKANAGAGEIYVRPQNGYELEELHNVNINHNVPLTNGNTLVYNSSNGLWENGGLVLTELLSDTSPQLGGDLDVNGYKIRSSTNGNIILEGNPNSTGEIRSVTRTTVVGVANDISRLTSAASTPLELTAAGNIFSFTGNYCSIRIGQGTADSINVFSSTTGAIILDNQSWPKTGGASGTVLTCNGSGGLSWDEGLKSDTAGYVKFTDRSGSQTAYANNATVDFPNFSGMVMVNRADVGSGNVALWLLGGGTGGTLKLGDSTSSAVSGTFSYVSGIAGYRWTNDTGGTINCSFTAFKGRNAG